jgi:hypothetical protein
VNAQAKQPQLTEDQKSRIRDRAEWAYIVDGDEHCPYAAGTPEAEQFRQYIRELQDNDR